MGDCLAKYGVSGQLGGNSSVARSAALSCGSEVMGGECPGFPRGAWHPCEGDPQLVGGHEGVVIQQPGPGVALCKPHRSAAVS